MNEEWDKFVAAIEYYLNELTFIKKTPQENITVVSKDDWFSYGAKFYSASYHHVFEFVFQAHCFAPKAFPELPIKITPKVGIYMKDLSNGHTGFDLYYPIWSRVLTLGAQSADGTAILIRSYYRDAYLDLKKYIKADSVELDPI